MNLNGTTLSSFRISTHSSQVRMTTEKIWRKGPKRMTRKVNVEVVVV
jgi:hypothetical protein